MKKLLGFITIFFLVFCLIGTLGSTPAKGEKDFKSVKRNLAIKEKPVYVENEIVVTFNKDARALESGLVDKFGLIKKERKLYPELFTVYDTSKSKRDIKSLMEEIKAVPGVAYVEQNSYVYSLWVPNDPYYSYQWHMERIGMENVWEHGTGLETRVAVIDTGVKQSLSDMANTSFSPGWDFINNDNDPTDDNGHGSHVAGTVAQSTNNGVGVAGVAYKARIMPIKVLNAQGSGNTALTALGIRWAVDHGAKVINLSLGGPGSSQTLLNEINHAWSKDVVIVCAAGNDGVSTPFYPAAYENSISVSATDYIDDLAAYSNYGSTIDICAPGGDLGADLNGDGYGDGVLQQTVINGADGYYFMDGTSMASPHVAGVVAMMRAVNRNLTNIEIKEILYATATDLGNPGWDPKYGWGLVNAEAAMQGANVAPVVNMYTNVVGNHVQFFDMSTDSNGSIVEWLWKLGDLSSSTEQHPVHNYTATGNYDIRLRVTDNHGAVKYKDKTITIDSVFQPSNYTYVKDVICVQDPLSTTRKLDLTIKVVNQDNLPVVGAEVGFMISYLPQGSGMSVVKETDFKGYARYSFSVPAAKMQKVGVFVLNINDSVYPYYPQANIKDRVYVTP